MKNRFVKTPKYAELLVADIPQKRRMDVMIAVLDKKDQGNGEKLHYFFNALFPLLDSGQQEEVFQRLSKELQLCESYRTITTVIQILRASDWPKLDEAARLRIENQLIESIAEGAFNQATGKCTSGGLGAWASGIFRHFTLKTQAIIAITNRLCSRSTPAEDYGLAFLFSSLPVLSASPDAYLQRELISKLEAGDERFFNAIQQQFSRPGDTWAQPFKEALAKFVPAQPTEPEQDDVPF